LSGTWFVGSGGVATIRQDADKLIFIDEGGKQAKAEFLTPDRVRVAPWGQDVDIVQDGFLTQIQWQGNVWERARLSGQWWVASNGQRAAVHQGPEKVVLIDETGKRTEGRFVSVDQFDAWGQRARIVQEGFQTRIVWNGNSWVQAYSFENGTLSLSGTESIDEVTLSFDNGVVKVNRAGIDYDENDFRRVTLVQFQGNAGDDSFIAHANFSIPIVAHGGDGNDKLYGGDGDDRLDGGLGRDELYGGGNRDGAVNPEPSDVQHGIEYRIKSLTDSDGTVYELEIENGQESGQLRRYANGRWEVMDDVRDFSLHDDDLHIQRTDYTWEATYLRGDLPAVMENSIAASTFVPAQSNMAPGTNRSIIGNTETDAGLNASYQNSNGQLVAARTLLDSVGMVATPGGLGSGTVLWLGGNQFVLTADHVVRGATAPQVTFTIPGITASPVGVRRIIRGNNFGDRDLALLELNAAVTGIQGAVLPDFSAANEGMQVLAVGYGINNAGGIGTRNFGYTTIDGFYRGARTDTDANGNPWRYNGPFVKYRYDRGEVAITTGDSGGPDIAPIRSIDDHGNVMWIPAIVAVHHSGQNSIDIDGDGDNDIPAIGDMTHSATITSDVAATIRQFIPASPEPALVFEQIMVLDDGDSNVSDSGEWHYTIEVNGLHMGFERSFDDGNLYPIGTTFHVGWTSQVEIAFYGKETDDGFFTGDDDEIKRWEDRVMVPTRNLGWRRLIMSGSVLGEDTAYQVVFSIGW